MHAKYMNSARSMKREAMDRADEIKSQAYALLDSLSSMDAAVLMSFTLIICILIYCKYFQNRSFGRPAMIIFLIGFGSFILMHSIGGFFNPMGTAHRVMGNIGNIFGLGLLITALFIELAGSKPAPTQALGGGGPPPPHY